MRKSLLVATRHISNRLRALQALLASSPRMSPGRDRNEQRCLRLVAVALWLATVPTLAHAGIWNGGLCNVYQEVLDNELLEIVSLTMLVGSLILWGLDDGRHNIKTSVIRGVAVTMGVLNMPLLWAQVFNHGAACTGTM